MTSRSEGEGVYTIVTSCDAGEEGLKVVWRHTHLREGTTDSQFTLPIRCMWQDE